MSALRDVARPMLASIFVIQGMHNFQNPDGVSAVAEPVVAPLRERVPGIPENTEQAVQINGAVQTVAGAMLGAGVMPRLAALAIAGSLVPTTLAAHRFWEASDPQERATQRIQFLKNLTIMGGLLLAAADTGGSPSVAWRRRHTSSMIHNMSDSWSDAALTFSRAFQKAATANGRH